MRVNLEMQITSPALTDDFTGEMQAIMERVAEVVGWLITENSERESVDLFDSDSVKVGTVVVSR